VYYSYPTLLTNASSFNDETVVKKSDQSLTATLDAISYPNADGSIPVPVVARKSPSPVPKIPINSFSPRLENNLANNAKEKEIVSNPAPTSVTKPNPVIPTPPIEVDRSNKPIGKFTASNGNIVINNNVPNGGVIPTEPVTPSPEHGVLANGHVSKTINVPGTNGISNGYGGHSNGIPDSPDSDGDTNTATTSNMKDSPGSTGLSKSFDSSSLALAPKRPSGPKPSINSGTSSNASLGSQRPASQDASATGSYTVKLKNETTEPRMGGGLKRSHSHPNLAQQVGVILNLWFFIRIPTYTFLFVLRSNVFVLVWLFGLAYLKFYHTFTLFRTLVSSRLRTRIPKDPPYRKFLVLVEILNRSQFGHMLQKHMEPDDESSKLLAV